MLFYRQCGQQKQRDDGLGPHPVHVPKTPAQCVRSVWVIVVSHQRDTLWLGHPHALRTDMTLDKYFWALSTVPSLAGRSVAQALMCAASTINVELW